MSKNAAAAVADVARIYGYDGSPIAPLSGGAFLYPGAGGVATLAPGAPVADRHKYWPIGDGAHQITTIAVNRAETLVVAAERRLKVSLHVYSYPQRRLVCTVPDVAKVEVADMAFSRDGAFLAVLAGPPACTLAVYTVDSAGRVSPYMAAAEQFGHHLRRVSFCPTAPEVLCTSGGGHCVFWSMDSATAALSPIEAAVQHPSTRTMCHQWLPDGSAICGTAAHGLLHFTDLTAPVGLPIGPRVGGGDNNSSSNLFASVADIALTKSHLVTLSPSGALHFFSTRDVTTGHTSIGDLPCRTVETGIAKASYVRLVPEHNALVVGGLGGHALFVALPGYDAEVRDDEFGLIVPKLAPLTLGFGGPLVGIAHGRGSCVAVVSKGALLTVVDYEANAIRAQLHIGIEPAAVCGINKTSCAAIASQTGSLRIVSYGADASSTTATPPRIIFKGRFSDAPLHAMASDATGRVLAAADSQYVFFFSITEEGSATGASADFIGCVRLTNVMGVNAVGFLPNGKGLLISHSSGDTVLLNVPTPETYGNVDNTDIKTVEQSALFVNSWRLDTPVCGFIVAAAYEDYLNIVTHSADKAGRLYLFDRTLAPERKDRESRVVKAQVLSGDHEKRGTRLRLAFGGKFLLSAGSDGKLCVRDASMYTKPWTPQPLTKERTEPLSVHLCHASLRGGVASFCVGFEGAAARRIVTAGVDGFVAVWNTPIAALAAPPLGTASLTVATDTTSFASASASPHPLAPDADDDVFFTDKNRREAAAVDAAAYQPYREGVQRRIDALRTRLEAIREENSAAADDEKVGLEDFLVTRHREAFDSAVDGAIGDMKSTVELSNLRRDYCADLIRRECWDVMDVKLTPLVALNTPNLLVYNFHQRKADAVDAALVRKLKFLRIVEEADRRHRGVRELEDVYDGPKVDPFSREAANATGIDPTSSPATKASAAATEGGDKEKEADGGENEEDALLHKDRVEELLAKPLMDQATEDPSPYLYNPLLVFTRSRSTIQKLLLQGRVQCLKKGFNAAFNALVERKHTELHHIKERNTRCRLVLKELGEEREVFDPKMALIEDPSHVFTVDEAAITGADKSTDPEEKRRLAQLEAERKRWVERNGTDGSSDKALKVWMDGRLDKDIRSLEINVPLPDFADETNADKFVPPEERTDDQTRIFKDYEAALSKRIEEVNLRREQLRAEFEKLQKQNFVAAKAFDDAIAELFHRRLVVSQHSSHVELSQIKLVQAVLMQEERLRIARKMEQRRKGLHDHLQRVGKVVLKASAAAAKITAEVSARREEERLIDRNVKAYPPFNDPEYGDRLVRHYNRKMRAKRKAQAETAANGGDLSSAAAAPAKPPTVNPTQDPFAFIEIEAQQQHQQQIGIAQATSSAMMSEQFASAHLGIINDKPTGDIANVPDALWQAYLMFRGERNVAEAEIERLAAEQAAAEAQLQLVNDQRQRIAEAVAEAVRTFELFLRDSIEEQYDVDDVYTMQQGQVEVDQAPVVMNFDDAVMVRTAVADRLNGLIRASNDEKLAAMADRMARLKEMSLIEWESDFFAFAAQSLEMQLRHLHTLRVTKQMQAFINGGGDDHNAREREKLAVKIDHVRQTMAEKIEDRRQQMQRLRRTMRDKEVENYILQDQVGESKALVDDRRAIRDLQSSEVDYMRSDKLMRDMRVTRKLEDVAKAQQAEMSTMKKEIDRLRERTFPSFAVVSKRVVGNPDQM